MPLDPQSQREIEGRIKARQLEAQRRAQAQVVETLNNVIPARYRHSDWDSLETAEPPIPGSILGALDLWCKNPTTNLLIIGEPRVGKTWAAVACLRRTVAPAHTVAFWACSGLLESSREQPGALAAAGRVRWLVLDDVGTEVPPHPTALERLGTIINRRDQECLPTIVTSCLDKTQLEQWLGPRSYERLRRGTRVIWAGKPRD